MPRLPLQTTIATLGLLTLAVPALAQVSGFVRDLTLAPIADARVSVQTGAATTVSAADGSFALPGATGTDLTIVAAKKGFFATSAIVTAPTAVLLAMRPVPQDDDPTYTLVAPEDCGSCHPTQHSEWLGSPMALAGGNTWVHDIYSGKGTPDGMGGFVYLRDSAFAAHNPASECASCHQPEAWIANPFSALIDQPSPPPAASHGIACDVCHKIADIDESRFNFPGIYPGVVTFTRPQGPTFEQVQYGVLRDVSFSSPSLMRSSYQPQLVAEVCAACHQDKNDPDEDGDFEEPNGVVSEPTYQEWDDSAFADPASPHYATCVDCHMPPAGVTEACNVQVPPVIRDPATIRSHRIEGTTPAYLENAVELAVAPQLAGDSLSVDVTITNSLTGHHVPTGVTVRNMILLVEAWREGDGAVLASTGTQTVHALGGIGDPTQGYYAGLPGKFFAKVNHDASGNGPTFFTDATGIQFDNRIPALATDISTYTFAVPSGGGTLRVRARLIYRRAFRFLVDAKQWTEDGHGNPLEDVQPPHFGHLMEEAERTILAVPCDGQPAGSSCSDGNVCNGAEVCDGAGQCQAGAALDCDDGNVCTDDTCDWTTGCDHFANAAPCEDGDACTTDDACIAAACVGGPPLDCDDGNACTDDTCDALGNCQSSAHGGACDDGDACTTADVCDAGACIGGPALECDDGNACTQDRCDPIAACVNAEEPQSACLVATRASIQIKDRENDSGDQIKWAWQKGEAVAQAALGNPFDIATYTLCVYDSVAGVPALATRLDVASGFDWRNKAPRGWTYRDKTRASDGVLRVQLRAGDLGKTRAQVKAKGTLIPMPAPSHPLRFFAGDPQVVVQLVNDQTPTCWTSEFSTANHKWNNGTRFQAKTP